MKRLMLACLLAGSALAQSNVSTGGTQVIGVPPSGAGSVSASTVAAAITSQTNCSTAGYVWVPASNTCQAQSIAPGSDAALRNLTTTTMNGTAVVSATATLSGMASSTCAAGCDIQVPSTYAGTEQSRFFTPQIGSPESYALALFSGGTGAANTVDTSMSEDHRLGNRWWVSTNETPLTAFATTFYNSMTPYVMDERVTHRFGYADFYSGLSILQSISGLGASNGGQGVPEKGNWATLVTRSNVRSPLQGGGTLDSTVVHTAPGDGVYQTLQEDTFGGSEGEDEYDELCRCFLETTTARFAVNLNGTPTIDAAGFGNYALDGAVATGYDLKQAGEHLPLVNLSRLYTAGNYTSVLSSSYNGFAKITGDAGTGWFGHFGASSITTITAAVDNQQYAAGCPTTITSSAARVPDPTITTEAGVGGLVAYCVTVASTAGFADGDESFVGGPSSNYEYAKVVHVADSTHMTMNLANYHQATDVVARGGAVGYAFSIAADDIAPNGIFNYHTEPNVTLHKFLPIMGSDSSGNLYVYFDKNGSNTISTRGYLSTTPNRAAAISSIDNTGVITFSDHGDYSTVSTPNLFGDGQTVLAAPSITFAAPSGGSCATLPVAKSVLSLSAYNAFQYGLTVTLTTVGNCTAPPTATIQSTWAAPYRIAPATMTKKVINPATGSMNDGHLLTAMLNPANWQAGELIEIPNWMHDGVHSQKNFGKYWHSGQTPGTGIMDITRFYGDWGRSETLMGVANMADGYKYFADATHLQGPGIAYEAPPNGFGFAGNFATILNIGLPPTLSMITTGCGDSGAGGSLPYNPCQIGTAMPFDVLNLWSTASTAILHYDGVSSLSWNGTFTPAHFTSPDVKLASLSVGGGIINGTSSAPQDVDFGYYGVYKGFSATGNLFAPLGDPSFSLRASIGGLYDNSAGMNALDGRVYDSSGNLVGSAWRGFQDQSLTLGGSTHCANSARICNSASTWAIDASGNEKAVSLSTSTPATGTCTTFTGYITLVVDGTSRKLGTCN